MNALLFPGQGSQRPGMGEGLFQRYPDWAQGAEELLDMPLRALCLNGSADDLRPTQICQPALFVVNAMAYRARCEDMVDDPGIDYLVGHSLGEYNALLAAGVFDFLTGVKIVKKRGALMASDTQNGLVAVLGLGNADVQEILDESGFDDLWIANDNADNQQVIGGSNASLRAAEEMFLDNYAFKYVYLPVSNAFHTPLLKAQADQFRAFLNGVEMQKPSIPVISNVDAQPHSVQTMADNLARHFHMPVLFADTVRMLKSKGVTGFDEIGGSSVLLDLVKYIR